QMEAALESRPEFDPHTAKRTFTIISSDYMTTVFLPALIERLAQVAPGVRIEIQPINEQAASLLERGGADLLISLESTVSPAHPSELIFEETHSCVVWQENSEVGDELTLEHYLAAAHVAVQLGSVRQASVDEVFLGTPAM